MNTTDAIRDAVSAAGGPAALAAKLRVSVRAVHKWMNTRLPAERVIAVSLASGKTLHELRPDLYPDPTWLPPSDEPSGHVGT